jgi:hypothetical protein
MTTAEHIAQHLLDVHEGGNWTEVDIMSTLKDVTFQEAITVTPASVNTIATILHHITFYNIIVRERLKGIGIEIPESNGFDMQPLTSDKDWKNLRAENIKSAHELADGMRLVDEAKLHQPIIEGQSTFYKNMQGCLEHIHYHLGQIILLKNLIRNNT